MKIPGYKVLLLLRFLLTLNLQNGYIHPDEFFQSIEVVAGDILDVEVYRPWEFNVSTTARPIRSVVLPYLTVGLPLLALRWLSRLTEWLLDFSLIGPWSVLVLPRLLAALLSCTADRHLQLLCRLGKRSDSRCLFVYCSSYVVLVYLTRTLSNALELLLFAALLYNVARFVHDADRELGRRAKGRRGLSNPAASVAAPSAHLIAFLLVVGTFNRPTFLAYAAAPMAFWLLRGYTTSMATSSISATTNVSLLRQVARLITSRGAMLLPVITLTALASVACDTLYYRGWIGRSLADLYSLDFLLAIEWVVTPWNFMLYNIDTANLSHHGLHSHVTHMLVNVPLLFGVLGVVAVVQHCWAVRLTFSARRRPPPLTAIDLLATVSLVAPLVILSMVPHQEPRFLLPLLVPLAFLHGERLTTSHSRVSQVLKVLWIAINLLCFAFYGLLHQGGVVPSLSFLHARHASGNLPDADIVYYRTYMPPRFLLLRPNELTTSIEGQHLRVHDLMGAPLQELTEEIGRLLLVGAARGYDTVLLSPASVRSRVREALSGYRLHLNKTFPLHLSMEDLPSLGLNPFAGVGLDMYTIYPAQ